MVVFGLGRTLRSYQGFTTCIGTSEILTVISEVFETQFVACICNFFHASIVLEKAIVDIVRLILLLKLVVSTEFIQLTLL